MNPVTPSTPSPETAAPEAPKSESTGVTPEKAALMKAIEGKEIEEPAPEAPKEEPKLRSETLAALAREKKRALMYQKQLKSEREQFEKEKQQWMEKLNRFDQADNPIAALQAKGWTYEDATNFVLNNNKYTPEDQIKSLQETIDRRFKEQEEKEQAKLKEEAERKRQDQERAITEFKESITDFVKENSETYELINLHNAYNVVFDTIQAYFDRTQKVMNNKEAADLVEQYLEDRIQESLKTKRLQSKFQQPSETEGKAPTSSASPSKTLSNQMSSSAPSLLPAKTEQERIARALAALEKTG